MYGIESDKARDAFNGVALVRIGQGTSERSYFEFANAPWERRVLSAFGYMGRAVKAARYGWASFVWAMNRGAK